ncbi:MAG: copper resistance protein NlpE, partial [Candidatus Margulisbacteria bacterium]|nr:copper resistance protein NlpE [Candidatus Margulisiibacteriota bacterium]
SYAYRNWIRLQQVVNYEPGSTTTYEGILPGADCAGLKTELTLYKDNTYFLKETYLATRDGDKTYTSFGRWQKIKSGQRDVIQLNYDKPKEIYNFLQMDPDTIVVIDKELHAIDCPMSLSLKRKNV